MKNRRKPVGLVLVALLTLLLVVSATPGVAHHSSTTDRLKRRIATLEGRVKDLHTRLTSAESANSQQGQEIDALQDQMAQLATSHSAMDQRVKSVEGRLTTAESGLTSAKSDISGLKNDVSSVKSEVTTIKSDVANAKNDIWTLKSKTTKMDSLSGDYTGPVGSSQIISVDASDITIPTFCGGKAAKWSSFSGLSC